VSPGVLHVSFLGITHPVLDLCERLLDRIEVRGVFRQEPQPCASCLDGASDGFGFMTAEIVENDDVTGFEGRNQLLVDIGAECLAIDRTIKDTRRGEPVTAQCSEKGQGAPASMRCEAVQPFSLYAPAAQRCHVGSDPGFIDEHQPARIEAILPGLPARPPAGDVRPFLLKGKQRFF